MTTSESRCDIGLLCVGSVFLEDEGLDSRAHCLPDVSALPPPEERVDVAILDLRASASAVSVESFRALRFKYPRAFMVAIVDSATPPQLRVEASKFGCDDFVLLNAGLTAAGFAARLRDALASERARYRVLVVDDDANNRELLEQELADANLEVRLAADGPAALVVGPWADLVLLDITMPAMDGREVCHRLRADSRTASTPIIMLTALDQILDKIQAYEMGANDYVTKPYDADQLVAKIRRLLWRAEAQRVSWGGERRPRGA